MPILTIVLGEGRSAEQKRKMVEKVTEALVETVNCKKEDVTIMIHDIKLGDISFGGKLRSDN